MATFRRSELLQKEDMQRRKSKSPMRSMTKNEKTQNYMKAAMQEPGMTPGKAYRKAKIMSEKPAKKLPEKRVMRKKGGKAKRMCK